VVAVVGPAVEGGHELVVGVEGDLQDPGALHTQGGDVDAALLREDDQRTLGGVTDHVPVA
jgi:hypothetical protein